MSQNKNLEGSRSFYDARIFCPLLIVLALTAGLFQNCATSSKFGYGIDPIDVQQQAQDVTPVLLSTGAVNIIRLEGSPLQLGIPNDLFSDQGLTSCSTATYSWSYLSNVTGATQTSLVESGSALQFLNLNLIDEGSYFVDVDCNGQTYQLGPVVLDVVPKLRVVNSNVTNQTVSEGSAANLDAVFSGPSPITYQWFYIPISGSKIALAGQTGQQLQIASAQLSDQGDYELVATSTEGGIGQTLKAGPGRLTVLPMSSISGSVSGTTLLQTGQPIQLTSTVSGASSPAYQWYYNSSLVAGATSPNFSIPNSQPTDSGTYSLVVTDGGQDYQIGSVNVVVQCAPGRVLIGGNCYANSRTCSVAQGSGIQFIEGSGSYGQCIVTACDPGFTNVNNTCLSSIGSCPVDHGTGTSTYAGGGQPGICVVQTCDPGYVNINNSCQRQICPVQNGVGLIHVEHGSLVCKVEYCNVNYVKYQNVCVPRAQSCSVLHGHGSVEYTSAGPGQCRVTSCDSGYVNIQNSCVRRECSVANGQGIIALSPGGGIQCRAVSCNSGYFLSGNRCVSQTCTTGNGSGYWTTRNSQQVCRLTRCNSPDLVIINNQCISSACPVAHGRGGIAIDVNHQTYCRPVSCVPGYAISGNSCVPSTGGSCPITHGTGIISNGGGSCLVNSCESGYVAYNNQCVQEVQRCSITNGSGTQTFTTSGPGVCNLVSCNSGYVRQGNQCVPGTQTCPIEHGTGYRSAYSNGFSQCMVRSCDSGYGATLTQQCLPLERSCYVGSGQGVQHLTAYGYSACEIETCDPNETLVMGVCRSDENLLCQPHRGNRSARGGKVFGYVYSLLKHKWNTNLNTATLPSNRLNGQVFFRRMRFSGGSYLYNIDGEILRHPNGSQVKNWFGLALYTQILPPDGARSGDYILALSSDDGSGLSCKVEGSWRSFIDHTNGNSCGVVRAAATMVTISRDKPMPIKVSYFQKSGAGRCLKLLYKRAGTSDPFREIPRSRLMLPNDTVNRCPEHQTPPN